MKSVLCCMHLSWEYVPVIFAMSLFDMAQYAAGRYNLAVLSNRGCYSDSARDSLAEEALKLKPDYILWLDADQEYPSNTPEILMNHIDGGKLVVGGLTPLKKKNEKGLGGKPSIWDLDADAVLVRHREVYLNQGLVKIDALGLGGIMTHPEVFKIMEYPWFRRMWNRDAKKLFGADFSFYINCKEAGIDVWCDTDLVFGHVKVGLVQLKEKQRLIHT